MMAHESVLFTFTNNSVIESSACYGTRYCKYFMYLFCTIKAYMQSVVDL